MFQNLGRSAVVGGLGFAAATYLIGGDARIELPFVGEVSSGVAVGLSVGSSSFIGGVATRYLVPMLRQSPNLEKFENKALQPALTGLSVVLVGRMLGDVPSPLMLAGVGAACEIGGEYIYGMFMPSA